LGSGAVCFQQCSACIIAVSGICGASVFAIPIIGSRSGGIVRSRKAGQSNRRVADFEMIQ
jgi:hypothetical protein